MKANLPSSLISNLEPSRHPLFTAMALHNDPYAVGDAQRKHKYIVVELALASKEFQAKLSIPRVHSDWPQIENVRADGLPVCAMSFKQW